MFMTSSRDCDVMSRDQNFKNYFMTHGKRLSIDQYKADLSTVFRLGFTSERKCMGISVSIIYYLLSGGWQAAIPSPQLLVGPRQF